MEELTKVSNTKKRKESVMNLHIDEAAETKSKKK